MIHQHKSRVGDGGGLARRLVKAWYCCTYQLTLYNLVAHDGKRRLGMATKILVKVWSVMSMIVHTKYATLGYIHVVQCQR